MCYETLRIKNEAGNSSVLLFSSQQNNSEFNEIKGVIYCLKVYLKSLSLGLRGLENHGNSVEHKWHPLYGCVCVVFCCVILDVLIVQNMVCTYFGCMEACPGVVYPGTSLPRYRWQGDICPC